MKPPPKRGPWGKAPHLKGGWGARPPSLGSDSPYPKPPVCKGALLGGKKGAVHMVVKISDF